MNSMLITANLHTHLYPLGNSQSIHLKVNKLPFYTNQFSSVLEFILVYLVFIYLNMFHLILNCLSSYTYRFKDMSLWMSLWIFISVPLPHLAYKCLVSL